MEICIKIGGKLHCFFLPVILWPIQWGRPGPGPVNYPPLFQDAIVLASLHAAAQHVTEGPIRTAVEGEFPPASRPCNKRPGPT
jgi:hypothetical protein